MKRLIISFDQPEQFEYWAQLYRASRESKELLAESQQLAFSLNAWIRDVLKKPVKLERIYTLKTNKYLNYNKLKNMSNSLLN